MPTLDFPDDELAAVTAAIRHAIEDDRYPHAPRLDPLKAALARLEAAMTPANEAHAPLMPASSPQAPPPAKADKRARR
jgi:hypothetical protein